MHTQTGLKNIEDVQIGEKILSWNEKTGEKEYKEVTELFLHEAEFLYEVRIQRTHDGSLTSLVDETILETTWNHPFRRLKTDGVASLLLDRGQKERKPEDSEWVEARYLKAGDILILSSGKEVAISGIRSYNVEATKVYNFEVADNHTYFVGEDGVLVHNYEVKVGTPPSISEQVFNSIVSGAISTVDGVRSGLGYTADILNKPADILASGSEWLSNQGALGAIASTVLNIPTGLLKIGSEALASPLTLLSNKRDFSGFGQGWDILQSGVLTGIDGIQNGLLAGISGIQSGLGFVERSLNDLTGESFTGAGNAIRSIEWLPPALSNLIASPVDIVTGGIKMGVESLTFPMQLAAYTGEFTSGEREIQLGDGIGTFANGIVTLPSAIDGAITGLGDLQMLIGDGFRNLPIIGGMLGYGADMFTGVLKAGAGVLTSPLRALNGLGDMNTYESILSDLKSGIDRTYSGVENTVGILARDISAGWIGALSQVGKTGFDLANVITGGTIDELGNLPKGVDEVEDPTQNRNATGFTKARDRFLRGFIPNYGMYGGGSWGSSEWGNNPNLILNRLDYASLNHDINMNEWKWIENVWSTNPSPHQWVGPIGAAYSLLGTAFFLPIAGVDGEIPFFNKNQDKEKSETAPERVK
ncbi:MAG: hypothetical protein JJT78_14880 [Leptospira sp.]|nr:hypothetical protein [Leptospira sp.]